MILYFLRHGDAGSPQAQNDDARELSPKGEASLRAAATIWRRLKLRPQVVITSPLPRAARTAELLVEGLQSKQPLVSDKRLRPGGRWADMADVLAAHPEAERVMFVGHEPDLSGAVALLTGASSVRLRKGGLACVEFSGVALPGAGELVWLIDPDLYKAEADASG